MQPAERAARELLSSIEATYKPTHDYVEVQPYMFRHLDLSFYDATTQALSAQGFRKLCDVEDRTLAAVPGNVLMPVMIRSLVSSDGSVMASIYHPRIKPLWLRFLLWITRKSPGKVIDMETEFTDGSFVVTSNAASAAAMDLPKLINAEYFSVATPVDVLRSRHAERVHTHLREHTTIVTKRVASHSDLIAAQNRMDAIKAAYRGEIGCVSREELERLAGRNSEFAHDVHAAVEAELRNRKA